MATINDIRKDGYYGEMVRASWEDEVYGINARACEVTYCQFMEKICKQMDENHDIIGTLEALINNGFSGINDSGNQLPLNIYPARNKSDLYSEFVGVSVGKVKLKDVFDEAVKHTDECLKDEDKFIHPTITILTDNWNPNTFKKYERKFIDYVINHGVFIYFFLVTGYGINRIPFLCGKNIKQLGGKYKNEKIEKLQPGDKLSMHKALNYLGRQIIINTYNCPNVFEWKTLELAPEPLRWYYSDYTGKDIDGKLSKDAILEFMKSIIPLIEYQKNLQNINFTACVFQTTNKNIEGSIGIDIPQQGVKFEVDIYRAKSDSSSVDSVLYKALIRLMEKNKIDVIQI